MPLKAVFFDLDGTLLDTAKDLGHALNCLLEEFNKPALPMARIRNVVSDGANALLKLGFGTPTSSEEFELLRKKLLDYYLQDLHSNTEFFDGLEALIEQLSNHNLLWGIVTNKPWTYTAPLLKAFHFASPPVAVICPDHVKNKKPAPDALHLACTQAACQVEEAIYIGDHSRDIECGHRAGMTTIAVGYGYIPLGENHQDWGASHSVETGPQLWPIIKKYL